MNFVGKALVLTYAAAVTFFFGVAVGIMESESKNKINEENY